MKKFKFIGAVGMAAMLAVLMMFTGCKKEVSISSIKLSSNAETIKIGQTVALSYTCDPTDANVESAVWSSSAESVATVDQKGVVTGVAEGTANIIVKVNDQFTATCAVTVATNITGIKLSCNTLTIKEDSIVELSYTVDPKDADVYKEEWTCDNPDVAMIYDKSVLGVGEGTALITLKVNGQFTDTCRVTVEKNIPPMTGITISSEAETINIGSTVQLSYTVEPADAKVESAVWNSSDLSVATVDENGLVTAIGVGNATIIITVNGTFAKECAVRVQESVLLPGKFSVSEGKQVQFTKGNLYWDGAAWGLESSQTDYPTEWSNLHVGHLFWTKTAENSYAESYSDGECTTSDKFFADGSDADHSLTIDGQSGLYALSSDEWTYLFNSRTSGLYKYGVTVSNEGTSYTNCLIIAPDGYSGTALSEITDWSLSNINSLGLVCLPAAGLRNGSSVSSAGSFGRYWSAAPNGDDKDRAYYLNFGDSKVSPSLNSSRSYGYPVRLVCSVSK